MRFSRIIELQKAQLGIGSATVSNTGRSFADMLRPDADVRLAKTPTK